MKAKVSTGKGFRGLVNYQTKPGASFIAASTGKEPSDFLRQCAMLRSSRPDVGKPVLHFSLSQPPGERLSDEQWQEAADQFLEEMGLSEYDYFAVRHTDTQHDHIHIAVNKIHPSGKLWNDSHSARKAMSACEKIEQRMGLTKTRTLAEFREDTGLCRNRIKDKELRMMERTGTVGDRRKAAITAKIAAERALKNGTQGRNSAKAGNANGSGVGLATHQASHGKAFRQATGSGVEPRKAIGKVGSRRVGEAVVFRIDSQVVARQLEEHIELYSMSPEAIDLAIRQAQRSGQVPLEIYGTPEFIEAARQRAAALKVPVSPSLASANPTPNTKGKHHEYRELCKSDTVEYRSETPPTSGNRVRTMSQINVVHRRRGQVLLPRNAQLQLDSVRTDPHHQVRRTDGQKIAEVTIMDKPYQTPFSLENPNSKSTPHTRLASTVAAIKKESQTWRQASMVLEWVRLEKSKGMPASQAIALAREANAINPRWLDNACRVENVPLPPSPDDEDENKGDSEANGYPTLPNGAMDRDATDAEWETARENHMRMKP